jgi:hypothetical protein
MTYGRVHIFGAYARPPQLDRRATGASRRSLLFLAAGNSSGSVVVTRLNANYLGGDLYIIRGSSAPGTTISVSGRETMVGPDGNFQVQVNANASIREVTIMAFDPQGNRSQYRLPLARNG